MQNSPYLASDKWYLPLILVPEELCFGVLAARKLKIATPACLWAVLDKSAPDRGGLGVACGSRAFGVL